MNVSHVWMVVRMLVDQSKLFLVVRQICPPRRSCRSSRSSKACAEPDQPIDRSNPSVATARNGRRAIYVDGSRRILSGQSDMTGCAPASRCTMGTSYRLTGCEGPKRRQHAALRAAPAAIFGWLVLVRSAKPCFSGACPLVGFYPVACPPTAIHPLAWGKAPQVAFAPPYGWNSTWAPALATGKIAHAVNG